MEIDILTKQDLEDFKKELIDIIRAELNNSNYDKQWMTNKDLKTMLSCSESTLNNLRASGALTYTKINNKIYYSQEDVNKLMNSSNRA